MAQQLRRVLTPSRSMIFVARALAAGTLMFAANAASAATLSAQDTTASHTRSAIDAPRSWTFGASLSGGTHEPLKTRLGHRDDRSLFILALTASHPLTESDQWVVRYTPGIVPFLVATGNREYSGLDGCPPREVCALRTPRGYVYPTASTRTAYAAGIIPLSFDATASLTQWLGVTVGASGGALLFDHVVPDPYAARFNFLADGNIGLKLRARGGAMTAGFRLNHISNGNRGVVNPGMDSRLLYVGFER